MDFKTANRIRQPLHARRPPKICVFWRAGTCNRDPCPFLHSAPPYRPAAAPATPSGGPPKPYQKPAGARVWRNPNPNRSSAALSKCASAPAPASPAPRKASALSVSAPRQASAPSAPAAPTVPAPSTVPTPTVVVPSTVPAVLAPIPSKVDAVCKDFISGRCSSEENCRFLHSWSISNCFSLLAPLKRHQKAITGIALPSGSDKLYSGSEDESLCVWDCHSGLCIGTVDMGGEVGCMTSKGPWVFVGIPNAVKALNTRTNTGLSLSGPTGQVHALYSSDEMLFAGTHDGCIFAWKFSAAMDCFDPPALLTGHKLAVVSLIVGDRRLYSGSMDSTLRVWDITTLQCLQTLTDHASGVMSLLCWDRYLLSCSLDKTIKIWVATESGSIEVTYTRTEEHGVLVLCGLHDDEGKPVLICACDDNCVRLYDLPSFSEMGKIFSKKEVRAILIGPDNSGLFFTGDGTGELKVWKWLTNEKPATS